MAKRGQNEGSIYQRKDGRWVACVSVSLADGRHARQLFYGKKRHEVQDKLTVALADIQKGLPVVMEKRTVEQYLKWWLEEVVKRKNRPSTYTSYEHLVRNHLVPALGKIPLARLTVQDVRGFVNQKQDSGLSSRTVQYCHAILRKALNVALKDEILARNVVALADPPRVVAKEVQPLTPQEARRFLEAVQTDRLAALFTIAVSLGLRQGEALALRWRDVDLETGKIRVRYALQRLLSNDSVPDGLERPDCEGRLKVDGCAGSPSSKREPGRPRQIHLVEPKTKKSRRMIALPQVTSSALAAHRIRQIDAQGTAGSRWRTPVVHCEGCLERVDDFVFPSAIGTPLDGCNVTKRFQRILKRANIPRHRFHDLRHTAATLLAVQGVHPKVIQAVLGWDQLSMVDRYTHFVDEMRKEAADKMDAILTPVAVNVAVNGPQIKLN
jgi:integrase